MILKNFLKPIRVREPKETFVVVEWGGLPNSEGKFIKKSKLWANEGGDALTHNANNGLQLKGMCAKRH
jgi:hypothetical protein